MISTNMTQWRHYRGPRATFALPAQAAAFATIVHEGLSLLPVVLPPALAFLVLG